MAARLADLSVEDREKALTIVRRECVDHRKATGREEVWRDIWTYYRGLLDEQSPYVNRHVSTYLWSAIHALIAMVEPMFFRTNPTFDLRCARLEDDEDLRLWEQLLWHQINFRSNVRWSLAKIMPEMFAFGSSFPMCLHRTEHKMVPVHVPGGPGEEPKQRHLRVRTQHGPSLIHFDLWNSFQHPDGRRGFSLEEVDGYTLTRRADEGTYDKQRVAQALVAAERRIKSERTKKGVKVGGKEDFVPGDDSLIQRDFLAMEAGTEAGDRLHAYLKGLVKDAWSQQFPVLHYADGDHYGAYLLDRSSKLMELDWRVGSAPDGTSPRMALTPFPDSRTIYGLSMGELAMPHLKMHSRFGQLAMDAAELTVHPQFLVSQQYDQLIGELFTGPGAINVAPTMGGEDPKMHVQAQILPDKWRSALDYRGEIERDVDLLFAQGDFSKGEVSRGRRPATELNLIAQSGSQRIQLVADRISAQFGSPLGFKMLCMNSVNLTESDIVDVLGLKAAGKRMPKLEMIHRAMTVVFRGSVMASNQQIMLSRYTQIAPIFQAMLPYMPMAHANEFMRRLLETAEMETVSRQLPPPDPKTATLMQMQLAAGASASGQGTPSRPSSPTDITGLMQGQAGAQAPPPPNQVET